MFKNFILILLSLVLLTGFSARAQDSAKSSEAGPNLIERILDRLSFGESPAPKDSLKSLEESGLQKGRVTIDSTNGTRYLFNVEYAITRSERERGLQGRTALREDQGMLFIFDKVQKQSFWMKDTLIPLDMLFIGENGKIHHIHHNAKPHDKSLITSRERVKAVLELAGGMTDRLHIEEGHMIYHPVFGNMNLLSSEP